jgi:hypothetical protein
VFRTNHATRVTPGLTVYEHEDLEDRRAVPACCGTLSGRVLGVPSVDRGTIEPESNSRRNAARLMKVTSPSGMTFSRRASPPTGAASGGPMEPQRLAPAQRPRSHRPRP